MKKLILSGILIYFTSITGCKKKPQVMEENVEASEQKDEIYYKDFSEKTGAQSVRAYFSYTNSICTISVPMPADSIATYSLDLNGDDTPDFLITASHSPREGNEYCGHCDDKVASSILIKGLAETNYIAVGGSSNPTRVFQSGEKIELTNKWVSATSLSYSNCTNSWMLGEAYIGLKMGSSIGYLHIKQTSYNGFVLIKLGFNKTAERSISCGQK